jgi:antirestriction protein ArdC
MKHYGKSEQVLQDMLKAFEAGDIPKALAQVFIRRRDNVPCRSWSISNQMLTALHGHADARGYRQWQEAGRQVRKGEKSFNILGPVYVKRKEKREDTGEEIEDTILVGFKSIPVFGLRQTEGDELPDVDQDAEDWLNSLPLVDVARAWGLTVTSYNGREGAALGKYRHGQAIAVGVENLSTWAHELVHAADDKAGGLHTKGKGYDEVVAELGGAVLLECLGLAQESDRGGCWQYLKHWAPTKDPLTACYKIITRVCKAVDLIISTAEELESQREAA